MARDCDSNTGLRGDAAELYCHRDRARRQSAGDLQIDLRQAGNLAGDAAAILRSDVLTSDRHRCGEDTVSEPGERLAVRTRWTGLPRAGEEDLHVVARIGWIGRGVVAVSAIMDVDGGSQSLSS